MLRNGLLAGAFVVLAVVAAIGWTRAERNQNPAPVNQPYAQTAQPAGYNNSASPAVDGYGNPVGGSQPVYANGAAYSNGNGQPGYTGQVSYAGSTAYPNGQDPCAYGTPGYRAGYSSDERYIQAIHRPVVVRRVEEAPPPYAEPGPPEGRHVTYTTREVHRGRSTKKSVAIVAGTAGVGAAVGALAGGGKGAGIGALAGGAGGFIYDRLTHNR